MTFLNNDVIQSLKATLLFTNSVYPDEIQHYAAFHLGLPCVPMYPFRGVDGFRKSCDYHINAVRRTSIVLHIKIL